MAQSLYEFSIKFKDNASAGLNGLASAADRVRGSVSGVISKFTSLQSIALGAITAGVGNEIIKTTADFQKYNAVLTNTFGDASIAAAAMSQIQKIAATTPFSVNELTESYVKLVNRGFVPTEKQIIKLGDLASSTGKPFDQLTEAILDAQTGEFERLKEFGIRASKANGLVTLSFKGVTKVVADNESAIQGALVAFGELKGVQGSMAGISKTLGGQLSNLGDNFDQLKLKIGTALNSQLTSGIGFLNKLMDTIGSSIGGFGQLFSNLATAFAPLINAFTSVFAVFAVFGSGGDLLGDVFSSLNAIITFITPAISALAGIISPVVQVLFNVGVAVFNSFTQIATAVNNLFLQIAPSLQYLTEGFLSSFDAGYVLSSVFDLIAQTISALTPFISALFSILSPVAVLLFKIGGFLLTIATYIVKAFGGFALGLVEGFGNAINYVAQFVGNLVKGLVSVLEYLGLISKETGVIQGKIQDKLGNKRYVDERGGKGILEQKLAQDKLAALSGNPNLPSLGALGQPNKKANTSKALGDIAGGGNKQLNITINIEKQIEKLEISASNITESASKISEIVLRAMNNAINGAQQIASN